MGYPFVRSQRQYACGNSPGSGFGKGIGSAEHFHLSELTGLSKKYRGSYVQFMIDFAR